MEKIVLISPWYIPAATISRLASVLWSSAFYTHITAGGFALLFGWVQFNKRIRIATPALHRNIGKLYLILALCSSLSAAYLALHAEGGVIAATGFLCLAIVWFISTLMGYQHCQACFAAVTLRIWLPLLIVIYGDFIKAYVLVAWLCWVPNIFVAYILNRNLNKMENKLVYDNSGINAESVVDWICWLIPGFLRIVQENAKSCKKSQTNR